jgi:hypothetical protein
MEETPKHRERESRFRFNRGREIKVLQAEAPKTIPIVRESVYRFGLEKNCTIH